MKIFKLLLYSILFIPIWGLLFLDLSHNSYSIFIGILYTFVSAYFIQFDNYLLNVKNKNLYILSFPFLYLILSFVLSSWKLSFMLNPILWGFLFLIFNIFLFKDLTIKKYLFFYLFFAYFYSFSIYTYWEKLNVIDEIPVDLIEAKNLKSNVNLNDFDFLIKTNDTINIKSNKEIILLETWNETCIPCIHSIQDLKPLFEKYSNKIDHYYVYESNKFNLEKIVDFKFIKNKEKILIDLNQDLYKSLNMNSYPYFLFFDNEGKLLDYFSGYNRSHKDYFINKIKEILK